MPLSQEAETLKTEGNACYSKGDFKAAIEKYTVAINVASDSATVLFANRAAAHLALKKYEEAFQDAEKATELDPKYAKGWGRLGAALEGLNNYSKAVDAYGQAIECISATSMSDADKRLKTQYEQAHARLEVKLETRHTVINEADIKNMKMPWELAQEGIIEDDLVTSSSGHCILEAAKDFEEAKSILKTVTVLPNGLMFGRTGGLEHLSNAIMTDERCIVMRGDDSLFQDINKYKFEASQWDAWITEGNPQEVIRLAKERLRQTNGDWDKVRPALSCLARSWIILGFFGRLSNRSQDDLFLFYDRASKLIELGCKEWPNVHRDDRGTIFDDTFLRGVRVLRMNQYMRAHEVQHLRNKFTLDGLLALADELLEELENSPDIKKIERPTFFYLSFFLYPKACAWSTRGYVYLRKGTYQSESTINEDSGWWNKKAGDAYVKAADLYPEDDEKHCDVLQTAIECYTVSNITARGMLDTMKRLRLAYPKMQRIWKNSLAALQGSHEQILCFFEMEDQFRKGVDEGIFRLDDPIDVMLRRTARRPLASS